MTMALALGGRAAVGRFLTTLVVAGGFALIAARASATVVVGVGFDDQCAQAERIFVGTVANVESRPNPAAPRYFETIVTFAVDESVAGDAAGTLALRFAGGRVGDERQSIDGMPEFAPGERYVVFTEPSDGAPLVSAIVGLNQGLYKVVTVEGAQGTRTVVRDRLEHAIDMRALSPRAAAATVGTGAEPDVDTFVAAIRAVRPR